MTALAIALVLCGGPKATGFWEWFLKHEVRLAESAAKDPVTAMKEIQTELDLELAINGRTEANREQVDNAAILVLGEYDKETKIGVIDFSSKPKKSHRPMTELAGVVDKL